MSEPLPSFRYYPDPVGDGTIARSDETCAACDRARGWIATSLLYSATVPDEARFCPWCIADGGAVRRWGGTFNELEAAASPLAQEELEHRTPNFERWQDWDWPAHCEDATAYMGQPAGTDLPDDARDSLRPGLGEDDIDALRSDRNATAYLFRCLHCGTHLARWDAG